MNDRVILAEVEFQFTVQAISSDLDLCEEWYEKEIHECIIWAIDHAKNCDDCKSFKIMKTEGAKTYLKGTVLENKTIRWDEVEFTTEDMPMVTPFWGIWDKVDVTPTGMGINLTAG